MRIYSLAHKTPPLFIEVPVPKQDSRWSDIYAQGVLTHSMMFLLGFGSVPTVW